ncbi:DUF1236 domain-containing protein [Pseudosulfitobacter sp. DSM 107133]|uniref:DUF1236 domain-containing protein n=1 Tax=Pseudosulfitobacter sp. DSM 107133 TaxID=2883100 RepID=UPI000DF1C152|nr:DUF1236 domain-containing protein [Pseudosulfitobacter sp. DSM 107133]UOA25747.1 hypothetical protein DSM107133_00431 [Pseudosulfitobacter sp. DSM 107133]
MSITKLGMASIIVLTAAAPVLAQNTAAVAATDLNIRSGPGPQYDILGVIPGGESAVVDGCLTDAAWCKVVFDGKSGWSSSDYLAVAVDEQAVALSTRPATVEVNSVTYEDTAQTQADKNTGAAAGATIGALTAYAVGGPIGGIIAGGIIGGAAGSAAVEPTTETVTYITTNPVETVYLDGEVAVGATVPANVPTYEVPQEGLRYLTINGQTVVVDAQTNAIVQVMR